MSISCGTGRVGWTHTRKVPAQKDPFKAPPLSPPLSLLLRLPVAYFVLRVYTMLSCMLTCTHASLCFLRHFAGSRLLQSRVEKECSFFFVRARCLSAGLRSWVLLTDQRGIEPPPAVCQRHKSDAIPTEPWGRLRRKRVQQPLPWLQVFNSFQGSLKTGGATSKW